MTVQSLMPFRKFFVLKRCYSAQCSDMCGVWCLLCSLLAFWQQCRCLLQWNWNIVMCAASRLDLWRVVFLSNQIANHTKKSYDGQENLFKLILSTVRLLIIGSWSKKKEYMEKREQLKPNAIDDEYVCVYVLISIWHTMLSRYTCKWLLRKWTGNFITPLLSRFNSFNTVAIWQHNTFFVPLEIDVRALWWWWWWRRRRLSSLSQLHLVQVVLHICRTGKYTHTCMHSMVHNINWSSKVLMEKLSWFYVLTLWTTSKETEPTEICFEWEMRRNTQQRSEMK